MPGSNLPSVAGAKLNLTSAPRPTATSSSKALATTAIDAVGVAKAPAIIDANVLAKASEGNANALSALRSTDPTVTLSQIREYLDVSNEVQQVKRAQFLLDEGVNPLSTSYGQLFTRELRDTFWKIARQQGGKDTTGDAALVIQGIQSKFPIVTGDIRLINTVGPTTLRIPGVTFTPVKF